MEVVSRNADRLEGFPGLRLGDPPRPFRVLIFPDLLPSIAAVVGPWWKRASLASGGNAAMEKVSPFSRTPSLPVLLDTR